MAEDTPEYGEREAPQRVDSEGDVMSIFSEFGGLIDDVAAAIEEELTKADQQDRIAVASLFRATLQRQTGSMSELFEEALGQLPGGGRRAVAQYLRATGAEDAIAGARRALRDRAFARRSLLDWIKLILELIKKIFTELTAFLEQEFDLPERVLRIFRIIRAILALIDNILELLERLLEGDGPVRMAELTRGMYSSLETYWRAETVLGGLHAVSGSMRNGESSQSGTGRQ